MSAEEAWEALSAELEEVEPLCNGRALFTADGLTDDQRADCASICARCRIADLCDAYATAARVDSGFWAGHSYSSKGQQPAGPRPRPGRPKKNTAPDGIRQPSTEGIESCPT